MQKETYEWIDSWCDLTDKSDLPRIALIGDSITRGYQKVVRDALSGRCYVDFFATSNAMDNPLYFGVLQLFLQNSSYAAIHYNFGLHGKHLDQTAYENGLLRVCSLLPKGCRLILATTTEPYLVEQGEEIYWTWAPLVKERNAVLLRFAKEKSIPVDDLHSLSLTMKKQELAGDGIHFSSDGFARLGKQVVATLETNLLNS